jgi:drug/metabolite transporter superfamily protein YnfA
MKGPRYGGPSLVIVGILMIAQAVHDSQPWWGAFGAVFVMLGLEWRMSK